jgi:micrococcal nuclease
MRTRVWVLGAVVLAASAVAAPAFADPCEAIPERGPMPPAVQPGRVFKGPVIYVGDGDSLCVGLGPARSQWVEVRLADFYAPELQEPGGRDAKAALEEIALRREVTCTAGKRSYDRVVARCTLRGISLGDLMRGAGVTEGGRGQ